MVEIGVLVSGCNRTITEMPRRPCAVVVGEGRVVVAPVAQITEHLLMVSRRSWVRYPFGASFLE